MDQSKAQERGKRRCLRKGTRPCTPPRMASPTSALGSTLARATGSSFFGESVPRRGVAQPVHKAETLPAATHARHDAYWASGQLPTTWGEGVQAQSYSLCAATPLRHPRALAVFARWPGLLPAWLSVRRAHCTPHPCSALQRGRRTSSRGI